jgi:hypothetical protein
MRLCIAADSVNHRNDTDLDRTAAQCGLLDVLDAASSFAGLRGLTWHPRPDGAGQLAVPPVETPEPLVVDRFLRELDAELFRYNVPRRPGDRLRLRVAIHYGQLVGRLIDSVVLHEALRLCPGAHLGVLLSAKVFDATVATLGTTIRPGWLRKVRDPWGEAWLLVPGMDVHRLPLDSPSYAASWNTSPRV